MGGICPKKEQENRENSVHPAIKQGNLRDEEAEKMNQSDTRPLYNGNDAKKNNENINTVHVPAANVPRQPARKDTVPQVKVVSQYELQAHQLDETTKRRFEEANKKAESENQEVLGKITEAKKEKVNQHDDFSTRWKEELDRRGVNSEKKDYDATSLKNTLQGSLSPTLKNELAVLPHTAAEQGNKGTDIDSLRTDYIVQVEIKTFLQLYNTLRSTPTSYAEIIRTKYLNMLDPFFCHKQTLRTYEEGKAAIDEAVKCLETQPGLSGLTVDVGLCVAAHIQAKRQAYEKKVFGEDRYAQMSMNVGRFAKVPQGSPLADCNVSVQNLNYQDILVNLFISDGDVSRRNRIAMVNKEFTKCGFGLFQRTKKSQIFCTLILAGAGIQGDKSKIPKELLQDAGALQL